MLVLLEDACFRVSEQLIIKIHLFIHGYIGQYASVLIMILLPVKGIEIDVAQSMICSAILIELLYQLLTIINLTLS